MDECRREPFKTREAEKSRGRGSRIPNGCYGIKHDSVCPSGLRICWYLWQGWSERIVENTAYTAERQPERDIIRLTMKPCRRLTLCWSPWIKMGWRLIAALFPDISPRHSRMSELTQAEAVKALGFLKQKAMSRRWQHDTGHYPAAYRDRRRAVEQGDDAWHKLRLGVITARKFTTW